MVHSLLTLWEAGVAAHLTQQCLVHCKHGLLTCGALMRLHTAHIHAWFCVACSTAASAASGGTQLPLAACRSTRSLNQGPTSSLANTPAMLLMMGAQILLEAGGQACAGPLLIVQAFHSICKDHLPCQNLDFFKA